MRSRGWADAALAAMGLVAAGCATGPALGAADPEVARIIASAGNPDSGMARAQKPDPNKVPEPITLLSIRPEDGVADPKAQQAARIWAVVNGEAILAEEVRATAQQALLYVRNLAEPERTQRTEEILKASLQKIVEREVVLQDAFTKLKSRGAEKVIEKLKEAAHKEFDKTWLKGMQETTKAKSEQELKQILRENGMSLEEARRDWERQFMAMEYLRSRVMPAVDRATGYQQLLEYYESHPEEFNVPDMVEWQDLFIAAARHPDRASARRFAESLAERLRRGEPFSKLSEEYDDGDGKLRKGAGIGRKRGEIRPADAETVLFQLKDDEIGPVIEMPTGFHVVRMFKRTYAGRLPFDLKVQKELKDKLRNEVGNVEMKRLVNEIKRNSVIEYAR
jgi:hypothetical protein